MRVAFIYDDQDDYGLSDRLEYADFCLPEEAQLIIESLQELGHNVQIIKGIDSLLEKLPTLSTSVDLVFNKIEGFHSRNREGMVPAVLEMTGIPFAGTDAYGYSLSLNKYHTKLVAIDKAIKTPGYEVIESIKELNKISRMFAPIIVKPVHEGSSMGCKVFHEINDDSLVTVQDMLKKYEQPVLVEEYISGTDISVSIIGTGESSRSIGIVEFSNLDGSYPEIASTEFKYVEHYNTSILDRDQETLGLINEEAIKIYNALGCRDYGRVDFRLCGNVPYFLEINPLPTLCIGGAFDICAKNEGMKMTDVINEITMSAMRRS